MITTGTVNKVREVLDQIAADALAMYEEQLREGNTSETQFASAMAAKRERVFRWAAQTTLDIVRDMDSADEVRALHQTAKQLRIDLDSLAIRIARLEQVVFDRQLN